jgi:hypothetical protein
MTLPVSWVSSCSMRFSPRSLSYPDCCLDVLPITTMNSVWNESLLKENTNNAKNHMKNVKVNTIRQNGFEPQKTHFLLASIDAIQYFPGNCENQQPNPNCTVILPDPESELQEKWN